MVKNTLKGNGGHIFRTFRQRQIANNKYLPRILDHFLSFASRGKFSVAVILMPSDKIFDFPLTV